MGQFRYIARNLFTVIAIVDITNMQGIRSALVMESLIQQQAPIRFGIIYVTENYKETQDRLSSDNKNELKMNNALKMTRLLMYLTKEVSPRFAMGFLRSVYIIISLYFK
jgi:hypothetical protein